jgi:thiamine-phosphate pyrophosphorylase
MTDTVQRLFLSIAPDPSLLEGLQPLLDNSAIACVLISPVAGEAMPTARDLTPMVAALQKSDIAVLFTVPELVAATGADGLHVAMGKGGDLSTIEQALRTMKPDRIVGIGGLFTRHGAMLAGESDADYVMFGEPALDGQTPPFAETLDMASWWSEVFTVPCVAHVADIEKVEIMAASGCDFVGLRIEAGQSADTIGALVERATLALQVTG